MATINIVFSLSHPLSDVHVLLIHNFFLLNNKLKIARRNIGASNEEKVTRNKKYQVLINKLQVRSNKKQGTTNM